MWFMKGTDLYGFFIFHAVEVSIKLISSQGWQLFSFLHGFHGNLEKQFKRSTNEAQMIV